jgi:two-component system heavy metal sensor histidine kinase CusS
MIIGALIRLVDNAIKFSKAEGGKVVLRALPLDGGLVLEVEDSGVGIPPEAQNHLWQLFYQVDRTRHEQQGTGCGLAIAHAVALMHGGRLSLTSTPGAGSTFRMHFPAAGPAAS